MTPLFVVHNAHKEHAVLHPAVHAVHNAAQGGRAVRRFDAHRRQIGGEAELKVERQEAALRKFVVQVVDQDVERVANAVKKVLKPRAFCLKIRDVARDVR